MFISRVLFHWYFWICQRYHLICRIDFCLYIHSSIMNAVIITYIILHVTCIQCKNRETSTLDSVSNYYYYYNTSCSIKYRIVIKFLQYF